MASPNLSEIVSSTLRAYSSKIADNVTANSPLLTRLKTRGRMQTFDGGHIIQENLEYAENDRGGSYSGYERLNPGPADVLSAAEYPIKQYAVPITISGLEQIQNSGGSKIYDLLEARIQNAEHTMTNLLSDGLYSDGTGNNGKDITGLQSQVATAPTSGTVGGINRANWSFWRNQTEDGGTFSADNILAEMNSLYISCTRNGDKPDLISLDDNLYGFFWDAIAENQRFSSASGNNDMASAGFGNLRFMRAEVVLGGGLDGDSPANRGYFLNTRFLKWRPHRDRNMVSKNAGMPIDQDAMVQYLFWAGNLCASNLSLQGVLYT